MNKLLSSKLGIFYSYLVLVCRRVCSIQSPLYPHMTPYDYGNLTYCGWLQNPAPPNRWLKAYRINYPSTGQEFAI